jgi:hypothetical protein
MAPPLAWSLIRAVSWVPLLVVTPLVPALAWLAWWMDGGLTPGAALALVRGGGLLLGAATAPVLADEMAGTTGAVPSPRWLRQWLRTALALGYAAMAWTATYLAVTALSAGPPPVLSGAARSALGCVLLGLAGAAFAVRRVPERHGAAGGATVAVLFVGSLFLPGNLSPWPQVGDPRWETVHIGWLLAAPVLLVALAVAHRDTR